MSPIFLGRVTNKANFAKFGKVVYGWVWVSNAFDNLGPEKVFPNM